MKQACLLVSSALAMSAACAAPTSYNIDPTHTFPSFEADHLGISVWRGKFNETKGKIVLDKAAGAGTVDVTVETNSIDFGLDVMNSKAKSDELFDTARYPQAHYKAPHLEDQRLQMHRPPDVQAGLVRRRRAGQFQPR